MQDQGNHYYCAACHSCTPSEKTHYSLIAGHNVKVLVERIKLVLSCEAMRVDLNTQPLPVLESVQTTQSVDPTKTSIGDFLARHQLQSGFEMMVSPEHWRKELSMILTAEYTQDDYETTRSSLNKNKKRRLYESDADVATHLASDFWKEAYAPKKPYKNINLLVAPQTVLGKMSPLYAFYELLRSVENSAITKFSMSDFSSTSLLLFARKGVHTAFHLDWAEALNIAFGIEVRGAHVCLFAMSALVLYGPALACSLSHALACSSFCLAYSFFHAGCDRPAQAHLDLVFCEPRFFPECIRFFEGEFSRCFHWNGR